MSNTVSAKSSRPEKLSALREITESLKGSDYCFVINYGGLTVSAFANLRGQLRQAGSRVKVVKNSYLMKIAKQESWPEELNAFLAGPTAVVTGNGEVTEVARTLVEFVKKNDKASIKGCDWDGKVLDVTKVEDLAKIPPKDQLRAMFLCTLKEPAARLARLMQAKIDAANEGGEAAPAEAPAEA